MLLLYASGPASPAITASDTAAAVKNLRPWPTKVSPANPRSRARWPPTSRPDMMNPAAPNAANTTTTTRSHGYQPGLRSSSTHAHAAVTASMAVRVSRAAMRSRIRQSVTAAMPVRAPIARSAASRA